jgi:uncharacterized protein (TIGR03437 family)
MKTALLAGVLLAVGVSRGQGVWERRANYPIEATEVSAAAIDGKVYAVCGLAAAGSTNALFVYDPVVDRWRRGAPLPVAGADHCNVAAAGGKLYLLGGLGALTGETFEYDPSLDRWQLVGRMPTARGASGVAAIGTKIYVAGGLAAGGSVSTFEVFDTGTRQWTRLPDMPTARDHLTAQAVGGKFYALSGRVGDVLPANEEYDPGTNAWRRRAPIPTPRGGLGSGVIGGKIQVLGGEGPSGTPQGTYRQNEEYDAVTDAWRSLTPMPTPRHGLYGATVGGCIFTPAGGPQAGAFYSDANEAFCLATEAPVLEAGGARNAASFGREVSAGMLVSLFGSRLAPLEQAATRLPLPVSIATVAVKAGAVALPLVYVSPGQINLYLPPEVGTGVVNVTVSHAGVESAALPVTLVGSSPGIFALGQEGQGQGAILIAGTAQVAGEARPARRGEAVEIYGTGLGRVVGDRTVETPVVTMGGVAAEVLYSGLAPGLVGVNQVNARVPQEVTPGARVAVVVRLGGRESNTVTMAVAQ